MSVRRAVFLDRDGVLVEDVGYLSSPDDLMVIDGVPDALRRMCERGFRLVVVSNQAGIARGLLTENELAGIHARLAMLLEREGVRVDAWLYCPHHPDEGAAPWRCACTCRKPAPGLLMRARELFELELSTSYLIGDRRSDVAAGRAAGCIPVLVRTGRGESEAERWPASADEVPDTIVDTLGEAAAWILQRETWK
ncbi:MAG: HAD-IIIA family hydrolase [Myxococcaceae bacterium]